MKVIFASLHESAYGTSRHSRHCNILSAIGIRADNGRPLLGLFSRSFDLVVDDLSRFREGLGRGCARHCCGQPQPVFVVYRHDETGLASEIETMEIVSLGLEDDGLRAHAALTSVIASSRGSSRRVR